MRTDMPRPYYLVFVDEAGDPGLTNVRPVDAAGSRVRADSTLQGEAYRATEGTI